MPTLATNKLAQRDFEIQEELESGVKLQGHEVKAAKNSQVSLKGSYVRIRDGEPWLVNAHIAPYQPKNTPEDYDPDHERKLLLNEKEIARLAGKQQESGLTIIPIKMYTVNGKIKLKIGIGKGLKKPDKREKIKKKEFERRKQRIVKGKR